MAISNDTKLSLYEQDYQLWLKQTLAQLRSRDFTKVDLQNLIEEIEDLGKSEKYAISSYLMRLCEHLLKVKYWEAERENCLRGWDLEITSFRIQIQRSLKSSPSLKNYLHENFLLEYGNGRKLFLKVSGLDATSVPEQPCFSLEEALMEDWLP
ncbi:DUF29 domain-containing protein [filamentous cyanobacterium CCP1]|nr:DUF29 domain-containing protein [filamentous cyanobacterium CCP2]PSB67353.1 DUF29 domain-containing protein [filamentous cyanobacterium CCP1]